MSTSVVLTGGYGKPPYERHRCDVSILYLAPFQVFEKISIVDYHACSLYLSSSAILS
jgi:hypothetical protein